MTLPNGNYSCVKCGADVGNGGAQSCAVISTVQRDNPILPVVYRLCREPRDGAPYGCEGQTFGPATLANYNETRP